MRLTGGPHDGRNEPALRGGIDPYNYPKFLALPLAMRVLEAAGAVDRGAVVAHPGR